MNTTENSETPPMPPSWLHNWTPARTGPENLDGWSAGPFAITRAAGGPDIPEYPT